MKHTPGPWEAKPENDYVPAQVWADGRELARVYGESHATRKANAHLMAAAPELFTALDELCSAIADARRRYDAGDYRAIESTALRICYKQGIEALAKVKEHVG